MILIPILGLIIFLYIFCIFPGFKGSRKIKNSVFDTDYAHRGLWNENSEKGIPENSLAAFRNACEKGYGIELDIQLSKDGEVIVFHDYTLERMTGVGRKISECTYEELSSMTLCNGRERIPSLQEVLEAVNGQVPLLIELKGESMNSELCNKAEEILKDYKGAYCVESFNPILLARYRKIRPDIFRGQLLTDSFRKKRAFLYLIIDNMLLNFLSRPDFVAFDKEIISSFPVNLTTKLFGVKRFMWTIKTKEERDLARSSDANAIFEERE
ncbi:MAG: glycerophosphodiester phosphodiesterase [Ruminococcaceae bacterium]|nr:glycerophosphodiester phosphodiesterase [Oscillospiraceae bacterium]